MKKMKSHAFKKDCYLLGQDKYNDYIWLEAASWNCSWYWGFGYIEVYTNQLKPNIARDITSHSHWSGLVGKQDDGKYLHHINEYLKVSVLTDSESWRLSDLMQSFYTLKESAELLGRGGSHLSSSGNLEILKNLTMVKTINEIMLPAIFAEVYKILEP